MLLPNQLKHKKQSEHAIHSFTCLELVQKKNKSLDSMEISGLHNLIGNKLLITEGVRCA